MKNIDIYSDIAERTGGDIYIGVVGPVRSGKSTFIKKFCEQMVIPNLPADIYRERMIDELPQSSGGRTIMTTEPKFIPEHGIELNIDKCKLNVRLVDCVGYIVPSSLGYVENDEPRMVKTPWFDEEIPFNMAAEIGTKKVITEHATIGVVVTTDASISDIPRIEYEEAEERVINELKDIRKPFVVILNCMYPESNSAATLADELSLKYGVPVIPLNCLQLSEEQLKNILVSVLYEFPLKKVAVHLPSWICGGNNRELSDELLQLINNNGKQLKKVSDINEFNNAVARSELIADIDFEEIDLGSGCVSVRVVIDNSIFYDMLSEITETKITNEYDMLKTIQKYKEVSKKYERIENALEQVNLTGYGIVMPTIDELSLEEPEIMKQGNKYGVRLKASAPSIHLLRADIKTEVAPIVGSEKQSEDLVKYLLDGFEDDPSQIWSSNIFGKSLDELVNEGLKTKLTHMPNEARGKLQQTLERVINEGCNGLICIII